MRPRLADHVIAVTVGPEMVAWVGETGGLHLLPASARSVVELCDGHTNVDDVVVAAADLHGLARSEIDHDVRVLLRELLDLQVLVASPP